MAPMRTAAVVALLGGVAAGQEGGIAGVAWLQGCWEMSAGSRVVEEHWTAPRAGAMLGLGRTTRDGRMIEYEMVVLKEQEGQLAYEAHPSGQAATSFLSREVGERIIVFENSGHDFPQRIGYELTGADTLQAWVEGAVNGQTRRQEFAYKRVRCD
jgi:hypothetical protein